MGDPEDKNLDLQVERLVRASCAMGNIRADEASGAKNDRGGLLELLDLVVTGDTLVVTHIDRLSRELTYGLQVIEGLHHAGVEFRSLAEDFDTAIAQAHPFTHSRLILRQLTEESRVHSTGRTSASNNNRHHRYRDSKSVHLDPCTERMLKFKQTALTYRSQTLSTVDVHAFGISGSQQPILAN